MEIWEHSKIRFYIKNTFWNLSFWFFAKKIYKDFVYEVNDEGFNLDVVMKMTYKKKRIKKRRFAGYFYDGRVYQDNPGIQNINQHTWRAWEKKGLIEAA